MNILIVAFEFPYPANHGGKVDVWNKIQSFKLQGHRIMLLTWAEIFRGSSPSKEDVNTVKTIVDELILLPIRRDLKMIFNLLRYPSVVSARILNNKDLMESIEKAKIFKPDFVFVEQVYAGLVGLIFSETLGIPCGVRLHNREYEYMSGQLRLEKNPKRKFAIYLACFHLKEFEESIIKRCDAYYDISINDLETRKLKGFKNGFWLPPITLKESNLEKKDVSQFDICFLGNLNSPNNVDGITWFITSVYPLVRLKIPTLKVLVMGSNPVESVKEICVKNDITLISNPEDPSTFQNNSNILINPIRFGSGINIKSIDMLFTPNQVVTTSIGVQGLPKSFEDSFFYM